VFDEIKRTRSLDELKIIERIRVDRYAKLFINGGIECPALRFLHFGIGLFGPNQFERGHKSVRVRLDSP